MPVGTDGSLLILVAAGSGFYDYAVCLGDDLMKLIDTTWRIHLLLLFCWTASLSGRAQTVNLATGNGGTINGAIFSWTAERPISNRGRVTFSVNVTGGAQNQFYRVKLAP